MFQITIPFDEFFRLISHEIPCNGVSLISYPSIAEAIRVTDPEGSICWIDESQGQPVLYTIEGWIQECKRRDKVENILTEIREQKKQEEANKSISNLEKVRQLDPALAALLEQQLKNL